MIRLSWDSETFPIRPGRQAPRVVCVQTKINGLERVELRDQGLDRIEVALDDDRILLVGHHVAYDAACAIATRPRLLVPFLRAYTLNRVACVFEREKLIRIAQGSLARYPKHGLEDLVGRYKLASPYQEGDKKGADSWRTRFHTLDGIPVDQWPEDPLRYAYADLVVDDVYEAQEALAPAAVLADQYRQARAAFWLYLTKAHGMRTDPRAIEVFGSLVEAEHGYVRALLTTGAPAALEQFRQAWEAQHPGAVLPDPAVPYHGGLVRPVGSKDTKLAADRMRRVCKVKGLPIPVTKTGKKKIAEGLLEPDQAGEEYTALDADSTTATGDPILIAYSRFVSIGTLRSRVDRLRAAALEGLPIQPTFDALKETGRVSCSGGDTKPGRELTAYGDQTQNLHRAPGLRECYTARDGCLILSVDWKAAELNGLGQCCIDLGLESNLARTINAGRDPHLWFAAVMNGWSYDHAAAMLAGLVGDTGAERTYNKKKAKAARQAAKACNFGFPGGLGAEKFRLYAAKTYQVFMSQEEAIERKAIWLEAFPEMVGYFAHINRLIQSGDPLVHFMSGRYRGDIRYTSAANSYFQGRIADMAKDAGWRLTLAIHTGGLPARLWNFVHDEFLIETRKEDAHEVAAKVVEIMEEAGRVWCPDVPVPAEPALSYSWRKGAEITHGPDGRLIPWEDRDCPDSTKEKIVAEVASGADPLYLSWVHGFTEDRVRALAA